MSDLERPEDLFHDTTPESPARKRRTRGFRKWVSEVPRSGNIQHARTAVDQMLKHLGLYNRLREQQAVTRWAEIVGKEIAAVTTAKSIREGCLRVAVKNAVWRSELGYIKQDICRKLNQTIGAKIVSDIKFI